MTGVANNVDTSVPGRQYWPGHTILVDTVITHIELSSFPFCGGQYATQGREYSSCWEFFFLWWQQKTRSKSPLHSLSSSSFDAVSFLLLDYYYVFSTTTNALFRYYSVAQAVIPTARST